MTKLYDVKGFADNGEYIGVEGVPADQIKPAETPDGIQVVAHLSWGKLTVSNLQLSVENLRPR